MRRLAALLEVMEGPFADEDAVPALCRYFSEAPPGDVAWAVAWLAGRRFARCATGAVVREAALRASGLPPWLFDACVAEAGDLHEAAAHALPPPTNGAQPVGLRTWVEQRLPSLRAAAAPDRAGLLASWLATSDPCERRLLLLLIGGRQLRVAPACLRRALAAHAAIDQSRVAARLIAWSAGSVLPDESSLRALLADHPSPVDRVASLPFAPVAKLLNADELGASGGPWLVRMVRHGRPMQLVTGEGEVRIWSADGDECSASLPAVVAVALGLPPATVLEGEWEAGRDDAVEEFVLTDLLCWAGEDLRSLPFVERLEALRGRCDRLPIASFASCADSGEMRLIRQRCRSLGGAGLQIRGQGDGYAIAPGYWPAEPLIVVAVLTYVRRDADRRGGDRLVGGFAVRPGRYPEKSAARAGLDGDADAEPWWPVAEVSLTPGDPAYFEVEAAARNHMVRRVGPVRLIDPVLLAEVEYEGVERRPRRRSGIALLAPRVRRFCGDATAVEADTLDRVVESVTPKALS